VRIVCWNIRAGGGTRVAGIARQLARWRPSLVVLCEFRGTPPSQELAAHLSRMGLSHQRATVSPEEPARNALLVAARSPLQRFQVDSAPDEPCRWLSLRIREQEPLVLGAMHIPNRSTGRKYLFHDAVVSLAADWTKRPAMLVGDTNTGWPKLDEEVPCFGPREGAFLDSIEALGWGDTFRRLHPRARAYSWYSPNGKNGFRLDQIFLNRLLLPRLRRASYVWGGGRVGALSDHAALLVDLSDTV
jgi:exodeoxyribonuclease-3